MINIDLAALVAAILNFSLFTAFILHLLSNRWIICQEKKVKLDKMTCEICKSTYYIQNQSNYWRCPACASLNKIKALKADIKGTSQ